MVPLTATGPEVYVATMTTLISDSYYYLSDALNQMKSIKLSDNQGGDNADCYKTILKYLKGLESAGAFKPDHLGYIIRIFEDTSDSRFNLWATQKYKEVMGLLRNIYCVTKTSCTLMISLPMVYLLNNLCENTATLLTQSKLI